MKQPIYLPSFKAAASLEFLPFPEGSERSNPPTASGGDALELVRALYDIVVIPDICTGEMNPGAMVTKTSFAQSPRGQQAGEASSFECMQQLVIQVS